MRTGTGTLHAAVGASDGDNVDMLIRAGANMHAHCASHGTPRFLALWRHWMRPEPAGHVVHIRKTYDAPCQCLRWIK